MRGSDTPKLGLRENLSQFCLLVVVNAFVGAMIGLERSILPAIAEHEFHLAAKTAVLSFIAAFGLSKAMANYFSGRFSDRFGRKPVLVAGWIVSAPVPFLLMWATSWNWVLFANVLLGVSQGLTWSTTVIMKIDLAGPKQRGLAMGLNEFAGYFAVAASALLTGYLASRYGWAHSLSLIPRFIEEFRHCYSTLSTRPSSTHLERGHRDGQPRALAQAANAV